jgi:hypothetical protein
LSFEESIFFFFRFLDFLKLDFVLVSFTDDPLAAHDKTGHSEKSIFLMDDQFAGKVDFSEMGLFMLQTKTSLEKRGVFRLNQNSDFSKSEVLWMRSKPKNGQKREFHLNLDDRSQFWHFQRKCAHAPRTALAPDAGAACAARVMLL